MMYRWFLLLCQLLTLLTYFFVLNYDNEILSTIVSVLFVILCFMYVTSWDNES